MNIKPKYFSGIKLKPGEYDIEVTKEGYEGYRKWVRLEEGENLHILIELEEHLSPIPTPSPSPYPIPPSPHLIPMASPNPHPTPAPTPRPFPTPAPTPRPFPTPSPHVDDTTSIKRYPTLSFPDEVEIQKEFAVLVSLTENLIAPGVITKSINKDYVASTEKDALEFDLAKTDEENEWEIDVFIYAPDFKILNGNISSLTLLRNGDSTQAIFRLKPKKIEAAEKKSQIFVTFQHQSIFLANVTRNISIIDPDYPKIEVKNLFAAPHASEKAKSLSPPSPSSMKAKKTKSMPGQPPVPFPLRLKQSALTIQIFNNPEGGGHVFIDSPFLQPMDQEYKPLSSLSEFLCNQFERFSLLQNRGSVIRLKETSTERSEDDSMAVMKGFGRELFQKFAPGIFVDAFWELSDRLGPEFDSIQILTNNPILPWELMVPVRRDGSDERNFLCVEFDIGRWHINQEANMVYARPLQSTVFKELLVIAPQYLEDRVLPYQEKEVHALESIIGFRRLAGKYNDVKGMLEELPTGFAHFSGHGMIIESANDILDYAIRLEDRDMNLLAWKGICKRDTRRNPIFFFNACNVGRAHRIANFVYGWAPTVLESGASGYIGSLWPLDDKSAADFSIKFYQSLDERLKNGQNASVAGVLRETRKSFLESGDPNSLAYIFYGDPHLSVERPQ